MPPRDSTLDGRWTRKPFGLSRVQPIYLSIYEAGRISLDYPGSVGWQHLFAYHTNHVDKLAKSLDSLLGEVTQTSESRFNCKIRVNDPKRKKIELIDLLQTCSQTTNIDIAKRVNGRGRTWLGQ